MGSSKFRWLAAGAAIFALGAVVGSLFFGGPVVRRMGAILWVDGESYVDAVSAFRRENELLYPSQRDAQSAAAPTAEPQPQSSARSVSLPQSIESADQPRPISLGAGGMLWLAPHSQVKLEVPHEATLLRGAIYVDPSRIDDDHASDTGDTSDYVAGDFIVNVEQREIVGRGARFVMAIEGNAVRVLPLYGAVEMGDRKYPSGQEATCSIAKSDEAPTVTSVPRPTHAVAWLAKAMGDPPAVGENPRFAWNEAGRWRDFSVRWRPEIPGGPTYEPHDWIFLVESPEDGNPLVAWAQAEVVRTILDYSGSDNTFSLLAAGRETEVWLSRRRPATPERVRQALAFLHSAKLPGPVDLRPALSEAATQAAAARRPVLVHLGAGGPSLAPDKIDSFIRLIPESARYVGIVVGSQAVSPLMRKAAMARDGYATSIAPSAQVRWQTLKALSALAAPRLVGVRVTDPSGKIELACSQDTLAPGDELTAIARLAADQPLPKSLEIVGRLNGREQRWTLPLASPPPDNK